MSKYKKGELITSLDVLAQQEFVYIGAKVYHCGWFMNMKARWLDRYIKKNWVYMAIRKEKDDETL